MRSLHLAPPARDTLQETAQPPVHRYRFPLRTRWHVIHFKAWATWADVWRNLRFLVRG